MVKYSNLSWKSPDQAKQSSDRVTNSIGVIGIAPEGNLIWFIFELDQTRRLEHESTLKNNKRYSSFSWKMTLRFESFSRTNGIFSFNQAAPGSRSISVS